MDWSVTAHLSLLSLSAFNTFLVLMGKAVRRDVMHINSEEPFFILKYSNINMQRGRHFLKDP